MLTEGSGQSRLGRPLPSRARKTVAGVALAAVLAFVAGSLLDVAEPFFHGPWLIGLACVIPTLATVAAARKATRSRRDRLSWALIALGLGCWTLAGIGRFTMFDDPGERPVPSWVDPLFLAMYPLVYAGLIVLIRNRLRNYRHVPIYDAVSGTLVLTAVCTAFLFEQVDILTATSRLGSAVLLAYPVGDVALLVAVLFALRFNGRRFDGPWPLVGLGLVLFIGADVAFVLSAPEDSYLGIALYGIWYLALILVMLGAWRDDVDVRELELGRGQVYLPVAFVALAIGVLVAGQYTDVAPLGVAAAVATIAVVMCELTISVREASWRIEGSPGLSTDQVTGLALPRQVDRWLSGIAPSRSDPDGREYPRLAVMMIEIDRFRTANLALGLRAGDDILSAVGTRLKRSVGHLGRIGRIETEGFVMILDRSGRDPVETAIADIHAAFEPPFWIEGLWVYLRPIIGVALAPENASSGADLLRLATVANRRAREGDRQTAFYAGESTTTRETLQLLAELEAGIDRGELELHYQPKVSASRDVTSAEALVRWRHPERGLLGPGAFLELAERNGLMQRMTERILGLAIEQMEAWSRQGVDLAIAVNLSMPNLLDDDLPGAIAADLDDHGLDRGRLTLEITENVIMSDPERVLGNVQALRDGGMRVSLDDFGAGTTSLAYLRDLPIDEVKMDRSLVAPLCDSGDDAVIISASITIAQSLGLHVVAEGAEDAETVAELVRLGCDEIQGYHFARPMPAEELPIWLEGSAAVG